MRRKYLLKSSIKSSNFARLVAKIIDLFLVLICSLLLYPVGLLISLCYMAVSDSIQNGQSVGKKFMGLAVVSLDDGRACSIKQSTIRNLPIMIPFVLAIIPLWGWLLAFLLFIPLVSLEIYLMYKLDSGHRLGDVMADTTVIPIDGEKSQNSSVIDRPL